MTKRLEGKLAVVTGGGTGIGFAIAEAFAGEGAEVVLVGRRRERLEEAAAKIGPRARIAPADVGDDDAVRGVFENLERVDLLVTCAGGAAFGPVESVPPKTWRELFHGRFFGQLSACHFAVPRMPPGSVILLCSGIAAGANVPNYSGGSALCGAVNALGRELAVELAPKGIRVNVLSPGLIAPTAIESNLGPEDLGRFVETTLRAIPLRRPGEPRNLAEAALFLATCDYMTGTVLDVDGGWTAT